MVVLCVSSSFYLTVLRGSWWFLIVLFGLLVVLGGSWWFLVVVGDSLRATKNIQEQKNP